MPTLLDTDIMSAFMRRNPIVSSRVDEYLLNYAQLSISIITRYEILRGLKAKRATAQLVQFEILCQSLQIFPITDSIIVRAADIYAPLYQNGQLIGDADILIASTALEHGFVLATNNEKHHGNIAGLILDNWLN